MRRKRQPTAAEELVATNLAGWREDAGLTIKQAADRCGVDQGKWWRWENGQMPRADEVARIIALTAGTAHAITLDAIANAGDGTEAA